jgi:NAD+ synthase (glutamine-hydrolysing)
MRVSLVQLNSTIGDFKGNADRMLVIVNRILATFSASEKPDLIVFPEQSLCGYPPMDLLDQESFLFGSVAALRRLQKLLPENIAVGVGYVDKNRERAGKSLVNTYSVLCNGKVLFTQAKTLLPTYDVFDEARYFEPARTRQVFAQDCGRVGFAICEDFWWEAPDASQKYTIDPVKELMDAGADVLIVPSASPFIAGKLTTRLNLAEKAVRAGSIPVLYCNAVGANDSLVFDGRSFAMAEDTSIRGVCGWGEEVLTYDTKTGKATRLVLDSPTQRPEGAEEDVNPHINRYDEIRRAIIVGIQDYLRKSGFSRVCLGLSGGIDSALVAVLAAQAIGSRNVTCISMPSRFSSTGSLDDAVELCRRNKLRLERIPIEVPFTAYLNALAVPFAGRPYDITEENLQARIRGTLLMAWSNKFNALLLTTGNKSEVATGYCTLYGDMNGSLAPIADLYKTEVYGLAAYINEIAVAQGGEEPVPEAIMNKAPSAELRHNQKDQDTLPEYAVLDGILRLYIEENRTMDEIVDAGFDRATVRRTLEMTAKAEYKRRQGAPAIKVSKRAFGVGRRLPLARTIHEVA